MTLWQGKSKRKTTGGRRRYSRKKRKFEISQDFEKPVIGPEKRKLVRSLGGNQKIRVVNGEYANVADKEGKVNKVKINNVYENPSNPNYVQRNILTKGAKIDTEMGKAEITSRPGQDGVVNAILVEE
ncbi:MAG: 30S ribosomal protein S8e [Candidatus Saliniplasma sp.]